MIRRPVAFRLSLAVCGLLAAVGPITAAEGGFRAGVAARAITPEKSVWMAGYAARNKPAEGKVHDLYAKALAVEDSGGKTLVLVTADLIGFPRGLSDEIAAEAEKRFGVKRDELALTCSHTHCGPVVFGNLTDMYPLSPDQVIDSTAYRGRLLVEIVAAIGDALKARQPAVLKYGKGSALFAVNRREPTEKGIINGKNPRGPVDHDVPVLLVEDPKDGKPRAVVFGYACHNTTLSFYEWCGDYAGFAQADIEAAFPGATAMFWTGCGADANPQPRGTLDLCRRHGRELADGVKAALKGEMKPISGRLTASYERISLELGAMPTRDSLVADTLSKNLPLRRRAERLLKALDRDGKLEDKYPHYPVQVWGFGNEILWVALGGEVVIDYALRLKEELPTSRALWVTAYANDVMAYIPSARVLREGGYEADSSMIYYGFPTRWAESVEGAIVAEVKVLAEKVQRPPAPATVGPRTPGEEKATFKVAPGFAVELVASEPDVVDPVAMCFDEKGRLFVAEMRGYPNGGVGTGTETRGRIRCLTDADGDGVFETATTFADGLRFPMGLQPWRNGLIVAVAPDILYLRDTDGDGKADKTTALYTGFNLANIQQMVNSLQFALDNRVHGCAGADGGVVRSVSEKDAAPVTLRNRGLRFDPDVPASLEATSGGGQYGLTADDAGHWFTATNSQHLRQIVLPDHYLRRNPFLGVSAVALDIAEHGPAARVYRISPFENWRVERTTRRAGGPTAKGFPTTELVPGGFFTSACSPLVYTADLFPAPFRGNNFVCDPANNLVHRELLEPKGAAFTARRVDAECEFLASTDNWFRPVSLTLGPDGALYVLDFYREVIETPLSLPDDIKRKLNLESRGRGRIWRVAPAGFTPTGAPDMGRYTTAQLAEALEHPNSWRRLTAQRLLLERKPADAAGAVRGRLACGAGKPGLSNLLWTLRGLDALAFGDLSPACDDPLPGNRENALRLSEPYFPSRPEFGKRALVQADDPSSHVRFQLALTAGSLPPADAATVLAKVLARDGADPWFQTAALSSAAGCGPELVRALLVEPVGETAMGSRNAVLTKAAAAVGAKGEEAAIAALLGLIAEGTPTSPGADAALLDGLGQGMRNSRRPLSAWIASPPPTAAPAVARLASRFDGAAQAVADVAARPAARLAAARLLAYGPFPLASPALAGALDPTMPGDLQSAAARSLAEFDDPKVGVLLLKGWSGYGPSLRREVLEAMSSRADRALLLLAAVGKGTVAANEIDPVRAEQFKSHRSPAVRALAATALKSAIDPDRARVVAGYAAVLDLKGEAARGRTVFKTHCAACHRLDGEGKDVGANLLAALPNKSGADLLVAVFDPNREVDPRYVTYRASTADGRQVTGIVAVETPTCVTLRRADGAEDTILRTNLESLRSTKISLMPEGFEKQIAARDAADLFAFLRAAVERK